MIPATVHAQLSPAEVVVAVASAPLAPQLLLAQDHPVAAAGARHDEEEEEA